MIPSHPVDRQDRSAEALLGFLSLANYLPILPALLSGRSSFVGIYELPGLIGQKLKYSCKLLMGLLWANVFGYLGVVLSGG